MTRTRTVDAGVGPLPEPRSSSALSALSGSLRRASQMLARSLEQVFAGVALPARSDAYAVVEVNDAVSEPALIEKFELHADVVWQGALAASHHDRA